jgi:hypothetical protein
MHTLGSSLWMVAWRVVTIYYCGQDKSVVVVAPGWVTAAKPAALVVIKVLGY